MALSSPREGCRRDGAWVALLWLAAAVFYWPVLFGGASFYFRDTLSIYYPQACITAHALRDGRVPLWEPSIGLGYPFQSDPHSMVGYPLTPLLLLPLPRAYDAFTVLHVPLAGTFLFLLLRRWRLGRLASFVGSCVLMFCGFTVTATCLTTLLRGLTWTVGALLAFEVFLAGGGWPCVLATALALTMGGSSTDPQYVLFALVLMAVLPLWRPGGCEWRRGLAGVVFASALAGAFLAYQYLPLAQLIACSDRVRGLETSEYSLFAVSCGNACNFALPLLFSDIATPEFGSNYAQKLPLITDMYWGMPVLALALGTLRLAFSPKQERSGDERPELARTALVSLILSVGAVLLAFGPQMPFYPILMAVVPPLKAFRYPTKYLLIASVAMAVSAALGFDSLTGRAAGRTRPWLARTMASFLGLTSAALAWLALSAPNIPSPFVIGPGASPSLLRSAWLANLGFAAAILATLLVLLELPARKGWAFPAPAFALFLLLDLTLATVHSYPVITDSFVSEPPRATEWMDKAIPGQPPTRFVSHSPRYFQMTGGRTVGSYMLLRRELMAEMRGALLGFDQILGFMSVRLYDQACFHDLVEDSDATTQDRLSGRASARYVVALEASGKPSSAARTLGRLGPIEVQEIDPTQVTTRAYIAAKALAVPGPVPVARETLLELPRTATYEGPTGRNLEPKQVRSCRIERYDSQSLAVDFDLDGEGLLVVTDVCYPGWHAQVEGRPRPIRKVAGLFRGVEVHGGEHRLSMRYEPAAFRAGSAISLCSLALAAVSLLPIWRRRLNSLLYTEPTRSG